MTKVRTAVSAALVAAAAVVGAPSAFAITDPATAPTDLIAAVWNTSTNTSFVLDLGVPFSSLTSSSSFENPAGFTQSWTVDTSGLGAGGATQFSVFALNDVPTAGCPVACVQQGKSILLGLNGTTSPGLTWASIANNIMPTTAGYFQTNMTGATTSLLSTSALNFWAGPGNPGINNGSFGTSLLNNLGSVAPGSALTFSMILQTAETARGTPPAYSQIGNATGAGVFTFSGSTLTYTLAGVSAVPLPAAAWLLISGLLGLGAIGRRREAVAEG